MESVGMCWLFENRSIANPKPCPFMQNARFSIRNVDGHLVLNVS